MENARTVTSPTLVALNSKAVCVHSLTILTNNTQPFSLTRPQPAHSLCRLFAYVFFLTHTHHFSSYHSRSALARETRQRKEAETELAFHKQRLADEHAALTQLESERNRLETELQAEREEKRATVELLRREQDTRREVSELFAVRGDVVSCGFCCCCVCVFGVSCRVGSHYVCVRVCVCSVDDQASRRATEAFAS